MNKKIYTSASTILATPKALECYNYLCHRQKLKDIDESLSEEFQDKHQAFFAAAIVGHNALQGERYKPDDKRKLEPLIKRTTWSDANSERFRTSFTYLVKLNYKSDDGSEIEDENDIINIVAELAEKGIRIIYEQVKEREEKFDFQEILDELSN